MDGDQTLVNNQLPTVNSQPAVGDQVPLMAPGLGQPQPQPQAPVTPRGLVQPVTQQTQENYPSPTNVTESSQPMVAQAAGPASAQGHLPDGQGLSGAGQALGQAVQSGAVPQSAQPQPTAGSFQKEQLVVPPVPENVPLVEIAENEKVPEEVEGWMEKLEQAGEIKIPEAIKKDEQVILDNASPATVRDTVVLPLTHRAAAQAAKKNVSESARWLYEWCARLVKMLKDRAKYANEVAGTLPPNKK